MPTETIPLPSFLQIEPVGQCNLRCQMCPIQFRQDGPPHGPPAFMTWDTFTSLIDQLPGLTELQLQGLGEPMMHPRFFDMIAYAARKRIHVGTNSNMTLLNPQRAERCVTSGLAELNISLDGATAETFERIRVRAHHDRVMRNIQLLLDTKERLGSAHPELKLVAVLMRQNLHELPELVRTAQRLKIAALFAQHLCHDFAESTLPDHYRPMRDFVNEQSLLNEDPTRVEHFFAEARADARELGIRLRLPRVRPVVHPPGTPGPARCDWPWRGAYAGYQGLAMPCCMVSTPDRINFGNLAQQGVEAIWNGPEYAEFRRALASDTPPEVCRSCSVYSHTF
jgi:radical SAM protein with 4Fe4S-binding SPASM domain